MKKNRLELLAAVLIIYLGIAILITMYITYVKLFEPQQTIYFEKEIRQPIIQQPIIQQQIIRETITNNTVTEKLITNKTANCIKIQQPNSDKYFLDCQTI